MPLRQRHPHQTRQSKSPSKASQHSGGTTDQRQMLWVLFSSGDRVGLHARER
jgi:hypothetical protein